MKRVKNIIKGGLQGYNSLLWRVSPVGQFLWDLMQKYGVRDVMIVIDDATSKRGRIISDMMFLNRKNRLNVQVINVDHEKMYTDVGAETFVMSFIDTVPADGIALGCRIADEEIKDTVAVFAGTLLETGKWIALYDQHLTHILTHDITQGKHKTIKIQAIVTCYNEEDIIGHTIKYLTEQGIFVHVIDNWSTDRSGEIIAKYANTNHLVTTEKYPVDGPSETYDWGELLTKVQNHAMAHYKEFDWFVHHDADEVREAPFRDVQSLAEGIYVVDALGYNAINHTVLDFIPPEGLVEKRNFMREQFLHFSFGFGRAYNEQVKAWKSQKDIDLVTAGGHYVHFDQQRIFPYRFVLLHFPLRSLAQAQKKIFHDRKKRWNAEERKRKWHRHYDTYKDDKDLIWNRKNYLIYKRHDIYKKHLTKMLSNIAQK